MWARPPSSCDLKHGTYDQDNAYRGAEPDQLEYTLVVDGDTVKIYLFDTCGLEQFRTLTSNYYRDAGAILLFYSVEDLYTLSNLYQWVEDAEGSVEKEASEITWALIGNKCDMPQEISEESIQQFCKDRLNTELSFYVSAKSGENVVNAFEAIVAAVHRKKLGVSTNNSVARPNVTLKPVVQKKVKCSC
eukprot:Em0018g707a